ncbi:hypothetical protein Tco_0294729 [Tanacetum coccineum]
MSRHHHHLLLFLLPSTPEYLTPSDDEVPIKDQPLIADASPIALSPTYVADFDHLEEDPEEDPADYLTDEGEDEEEKEESSEDDDDEEEEASEDDEDDEKEEHLAPADSTLPPIDSVPSAEETEPFETDEARIFVRPHTLPSPSAESRITEYPAAPTPPSPPPSTLSSPLPQIPSPPLPSPPSLLPSTAYRTDIFEAEMPPQKRVYFISFEGRVMTAVEEVNERVIDLAATQRQDVHELYVRHGDTQDYRDALRAQISLLTRERGDTFALWLLLMSEMLFMPDMHGFIMRIGSRLWRLVVTTVISSSESHATVTYTSISTNSNLPPWGFHLLDPYEFEAPKEAPQSPEQAPPSPAYVPAPEYSESYVADFDPLEDDPEEDLADEGEDEEEKEKLHRARIFVQPHTPPSPYAETRIVEYAAVPTPPSLPPSPLSPLSCPLPQIPSPPLPSPPLLLPSTAHRTDISEAKMPPRKRVCFTAPTRRFKVRESSTAVAARQIGLTLAHKVDYGFIDTLDASIRAFKGRVMTTIEEVKKRVIDLAATQRQDVHELYRGRRYFCFMASSYERDAVYARQARAYSKDKIQAMEARIRTLEAQVRTLQTQHEGIQWQRHEVGDMVTRAYGRIYALEARDPTHPDDVEDAGSSC